MTRIGKREKVVEYWPLEVPVSQKEKSTEPSPSVPEKVSEPEPAKTREKVRV